MQPGALHRLEQPQRALLPARDGRIGQQRRDDGGRDRRSQAAHAANMPAVRILVCASEAPRAPLNGSRLVLHELLPRLAQRAELTVLALRRPDQDGPAPSGFELLELALPDPSPARAWAMRGAALAFNEPVEARRLAAPFNRALPKLLAERHFDAAHVMLGSLAQVALRRRPCADRPARRLAPQRARRGRPRAGRGALVAARAGERGAPLGGDRLPVVRARGAGDRGGRARGRGARSVAARRDDPQRRRRRPLHAAATRRAATGSCSPARSTRRPTSRPRCAWRTGSCRSCGASCRTRT